MNIFDFLSGLIPQVPWFGPPLPRSWGIVWPWVQAQDSLDFSPSIAGFLPPLPEAGPQVLYQNTEELEVIRDASGGIEKVIRTIKVTKNE